MTTCSHRRTKPTNLAGLRWCETCDAVAEAKPGRYVHEQVEADGHVFDSKAEYAEYVDLRRRELVGEIGDIIVHPKYVFRVGSETIKRYCADFEYFDRRTGETVTVDVKSTATRKARDWAMTRKLFRACVGRELVEVLR